MAEPDQHGSARQLWHGFAAENEAMRTTKRREARRVAGKDGLRLFHAKNDSPGVLERPSTPGSGLVRRR